MIVMFMLQNTEDFFYTSFIEINSPSLIRIHFFILMQANSSTFLKLFRHVNKNLLHIPYNCMNLKYIYNAIHSGVTNTNRKILTTREKAITHSANNSVIKEQSSQVLKYLNTLTIKPQCTYRGRINIKKAW